MAWDSVFTSVSLGLLSATSPCILPLYPGFLAYLSGRQEEAGKRAGATPGALCPARRADHDARPGADHRADLGLGGPGAGLCHPAGRPDDRGAGRDAVARPQPLQALPQIQVPVLSNTYANAFVYGLLYGPIALPCSGPLVVGIFTLSLTVGEAFSKLGIFLWFGLGFGLPLLALSLLSGAAQRWITRQFALHARMINIIGGVSAGGDRNL